ncbi:ATP-binding cassette domain-containing protein [Clostridium sp. MSJ-11]|uniref:ATP-binding cassette domain-containing protein n=1 Tax=Clostridium mobile TaxID=2841512 RepID=A0ABS6EF69_9CLOT|nr:ATP-binding cassette domain-containing protein [Clostridium mobile]MBU5483856.1 ATP-binding cassette domain-containing protein [Clostridium mobile]
MLTIKNLLKIFNKDTANENILFNGLSFHINEGDFITVVGSNGAGKSTLLNIIAGSIEVDNGEMTLEGKDISKLPEFKRTRSIGRVFQDPSMGTSPSMTILENLSLANNKGKRFGLSKGVSVKDIDYFKELLSKLNLGLEDKLHTKVGMLSGGQRQALALIMTVMSEPSLMLLDEHTAALDPKTSERILELTNQIVEEKKITTLMVTHNLNHAIKTGNRLIMMHRGEIILDIKGEDKKNLTINKLLSYFDNIQSSELISDRTLFS